MHGPKWRSARSGHYIVVADCTIVESVQTIEKTGQQRCDSFYKDRLIARTKQLNDTITEAKLPLFQTCAQSKNKAVKSGESTQKWPNLVFHPEYCLSSSTHWHGWFFSHENQSYPPSLSNHGAFRSGTKSDLLLCVSELVPHHDTVKAYEAHAVILDGAAVVNMIKTRTPVSFDGYVTQAMEYERKQSRGDVQRVDIWCLINTGRIAWKQPHVRREVNVSEGTWKGTSKYQVTGQSFCV